MKKIIIIILLCQVTPLLWRGAWGEAIGQDQHLIDSLQLQLKNHNALKLELGKNAPVLYDSTAANILADLSQAFWFVDYLKAMDYAQQCLKLSEQIGYKKGIAKAYNGMGVINIYQGNNLPALNFLTKALKIREEVANQKDIASTVNNLGAVYYIMCMYPEALKNYFTALKINELIGNKYNRAQNMENIGSVYSDMGNFDEASKCLSLALEMNEEIGNKEQIASTRIKIADMYIRKEDFTTALQQLELALKLNSEAGSPGTEASALIQLGKVYSKQGKYQDALKALFKSLKISEELGEKSGVADSYNLIGAVYFKQKRYNDATEYLLKGLTVSKEIANAEKIKDSYESLAVLDSSQGNYVKALEYYKLSIAYRDSIQNTEIANKTAILQLQYDTEKKEQQIALLNTDKKIQEKEIGKKKTERNGFIAGCILLLMIGGVAYNRYQLKQKTNKELSDALTQLKQVQLKLIEQEKLVSLGQLTAGIAHEIQNPLNFVINFSQLSNSLFDDLKNNNYTNEKQEIINDLEDNINKIERHGNRAEIIIQSMLMHSRSGEIKTEMTNLNNLCNEALNFSWSTMSMSNPDFNCEQEMVLDKNLPHASIVHQDILRVLINLINNALYAVWEKRQSSQTLAGYHPHIKLQTSFKDAHIQIKISDNGNGISDEFKNKIFQPFFTTKPTTIGTGLGLSISYDIVKVHAGSLVLESTSSNGTTFVLNLPV